MKPDSTGRIVFGGLAASAGSLSIIDEKIAQAQASGKSLGAAARRLGWRLALAAGVGPRREERVQGFPSPTMRGLGERSHLLDAKIESADLTSLTSST